MEVGVDTFRVRLLQLGHDLPHIILELCVLLERNDGDVHGEAGGACEVDALERHVLCQPRRPQPDRHLLLDLCAGATRHALRSAIAGSRVGGGGAEGLDGAAFDGRQTDKTGSC